MASPSNFTLYFLTIMLCAISLFSSTHCSECHHHPKFHTKHLFVFGDSLFDTGNNQYLETNEENPYFPGTRPPYGKTFFGKPTGRVSDGRLVPDFIAIFANMCLPVPYLEPDAVYKQGTNFASAGSGALDNANTKTINLREQLQNFRTFAAQLEHILGPDEAKNVFKSAVFLFSIGGNDYFSFNTNNKDPTISEQIARVGEVMSSLTHAIEEVYARGGRKFAFQNVGPLGCMPIIRQNTGELDVDCVERFMRHARLHNNFLAIVLAEFENSKPDFKYALFDYYNALRDRTLNPEKYGFKVGYMGCCGTGELRGGNCSGGSNGVDFEECCDPNKFVFFDGGHTGDRTNLQLAELMWNGAADVTGPHYNVEKLFQL